MAELQRAAQVEFVLIQQNGRLFLLRGTEFEVLIPRSRELVLAHTQPGPAGFMALRPSLLDRLSIPSSQQSSFIIGPEGHWIRFARTGRPRILAGGILGE